MPPAPDALWSRHGGKRHLALVLLGVGVFGILVALGVNAFVTDDFADGVEKVIGGIITGFFAFGLLLCVAAAVSLPWRSHRLPGVAVDAAGIWFAREARPTLVAWSDIAGVGIGYLKEPAAGAVDGPRPRKNFALEVFLRDPGAPGALAPWVATESPPRPDLPADRLRYVLLLGSDRDELQQAVSRYAPDLWVGEYKRKWTRLSMLGK